MNIFCIRSLNSCKLLTLRSSFRLVPRYWVNKRLGAGPFSMLVEHTARFPSSTAQPLVNNKSVKDSSKIWLFSQKQGV